MSGVVQAAGGLVRVMGADEEPCIALIHRPRYDDWSFPKGKLHDGESHQDAARREVEEETGLRCELLSELASIEYVDRRGRAKVVRYWTMQPVGGNFAPSEEVDELRWLGRADALSLLTYGHDRQLLRSWGPPL
jgi:8-oxo-dGTP diphosphatase